MADPELTLSRARFDAKTGSWNPGGKSPTALSGFDTFWYVWSLSHPRTQILKPAKKSTHKGER